ncbi:hypothetical protein [Sanyastnella coralliicola]|uniref:hypothetical protein n=1 Tax=Sanyastnella coralliicola TaxID=3069118 RepID=UPI0027B99892|nr:hypothetical protein [Longitalea sp. SCSIO 12813]
MEEMILDNPRENGMERRRKLLPVWIKIFIWFFLISGILTPFVHVFGIIFEKHSSSIYGLLSSSSLSITSFIVSAIYLFKGLVAYGLWFEKDWGVKYAQIDAIVGIIICFLAMVLLPFVTDVVKFSFRFEILFLIPYYLKMIRIQQEWTARGIF